MCWCEGCPTSCWMPSVSPPAPLSRYYYDHRYCLDFLAGFFFFSKKNKEGKDQWENKKTNQKHLITGCRVAPPRPVCSLGATILSFELFKMPLTGSCIRGLEVQTHKYTLGVKIKRITPHLAGGSFQLRSAQSQSVCERLHTEPWEGSFRFAEEEEDICIFINERSLPKFQILLPT